MGDGPRLLAGQTGEKGFGPGRRVVTDAQVAVRHAHPWSKLMGDLGLLSLSRQPALTSTRSERARVAAGLRGHPRLRKLRGRDIRRAPTLARPDDRADPAPQSHRCEQPVIGEGLRLADDKAPRLDVSLTGTL